MVIVWGPGWMCWDQRPVKDLWAAWRAAPADSRRISCRELVFAVLSLSQIACVCRCHVDVHATHHQYARDVRSVALSISSLQSTAKSAHGGLVREATAQVGARNAADRTHVESKSLGS